MGCGHNAVLPQGLLSAHGGQLQGARRPSTAAIRSTGVVAARQVAGGGNRKGCFAVRNGNKQTFVMGNSSKVAIDPQKTLYNRFVRWSGREGHMAVPVRDQAAACYVAVTLNLSWPEIELSCGRSTACLLVAGFPPVPDRPARF